MTSRLPHPVVGTGPLLTVLLLGTMWRPQLLGQPLIAEWSGWGQQQCLATWGPGHRRAGGGTANGSVWVSRDRSPWVGERIQGLGDCKVRVQAERERGAWGVAGVAQGGPGDLLLAQRANDQMGKALSECVRRASPSCSRTWRC